MKTSKLIQRAIELKKQSYTHIASCVKRYMYTTYYHVVAIDDIIAQGKWIPAHFCPMHPGKKGTWRGRVGIAENKIDWSKTVRKGNLKYIFRGTSLE